MSKFYHGQEPNNPSQIKLLANAHINFCELFDEVDAVATSKKDDIGTAKKYMLKPELTRDTMRNYYSDVDITYTDLDEKNRTGSLLITGHNLLDMAIRGAKNYKKALAFCAEKYDMDKTEVKHLGDTVDDVIEHVRIQMYKLLVKKGKTDEFDVDSEGDEIGDKDDSESKENDNEEESSGDKSTESDVLEVIPSDYIFPSFIVFVIWGPFAQPDNRLEILLIDDKDKSKKEGTWAQQRINKAKKKQNDSASDTATERGFSTDQRIEIEHLNVSKQFIRDRQRELSIVGFSIEESALAIQLESAERRAMLRCPEYDVANVYWKRVDELIEEQDIVRRCSRDFNASAFKDAKMISLFQSVPSPNKDSVIDMKTLNDEDTTATMADESTPAPTPFEKNDEGDTNDKVGDTGTDVTKLTSNLGVDETKKRRGDIVTKSTSNLGGDKTKKRRGDNDTDVTKSTSNLGGGKTKKRRGGRKRKQPNDKEDNTTPTVS